MRWAVTYSVYTLQSPQHAPSFDCAVSIEEITLENVPTTQLVYLLTVSRFTFPRSHATYGMLNSIFCRVPSTVPVCCRRLDTPLRHSRRRWTRFQPGQAHRQLHIQAERFSGPLSTPPAPPTSPPHLNNYVDRYSFHSHQVAPTGFCSESCDSLAESFLATMPHECLL